MEAMWDPAGTNDLVLPLPDVVSGEEVTDIREILSEPAAEFPPIDPGGDSGGSWIVVPTPPRPKSASIWHYTDANGLLGILNSQELWATGLGFLNDSAELTYGRQLFAEVTQEALESRHVHPTQKEFLRAVAREVDVRLSSNDLFVCCASEAPDSLSQWRAYGGAQTPYALELTIDEAPAILDPAHPTSTGSTWSLGGQWTSVVYGRQEQRELILQLLAAVCAMTPPPPTRVSTVDKPRVDVATQVTGHAASAAGIIASLKDPAFEDEREVRLVVAAPPGVHVSRYRAGRYGITPYVCLAYPPEPAPRNSGYWTIDTKGALSLTRIMVGPSPHKESSKVGVRSLLHSLGIDDVPVISSASTVR